MWKASNCLTSGRSNLTSALWRVQLTNGMARYDAVAGASGGKAWLINSASVNGTNAQLGNPLDEISAELRSQYSTDNVHDAKTKASKLPARVETFNEHILICRDGSPV